MRAYLKLLLVFTLTAGAASASRIFVPDAVPVADSEAPQWVLQTAFVLRSIELIGLGGIVLALVAGLAAWFGKRSETPTAR
jgi:hypothetical protein